MYQKSQSYDVCFLRYGVRQTLSFWVIFALLLPLQPRKLKLWKNGNTPGDIILLHICTKNKDMECDRQNCLLFWAIFCPFTSKTTRKIKILEKWKNENLKVLSFYICVPYVTNIWCMVPETWSATDKCFIVWANFCPFYPSNSPKNQNFEKLKKKLGDLELSYETQSRHDSSRHLNFFSFSIYHGATPQTQWTKQTVKKLNLWGKWL